MSLNRKSFYDLKVKVFGKGGLGGEPFFLKKVSTQENDERYRDKVLKVKGTAPKEPLFMSVVSEKA